MKKLKLISLMLIATTMAACSSGDNDATPQRPEVRALSFEVSETPYAIPNGSRITRAAIASSLDKFYLNYVYLLGSEPQTNGSSMETTKDGEKGWKVGDGNTGWPDTENMVNWYACSEHVPFYKGEQATGPYINFSVNETASDQKDLLVAKASGTYAETGGKLSFTFNHVCSALRIYVKKANNLADYTLTVSEVKLYNVVSQGDYYFNTSSWTLGATKSNYTLYSGAGLTLGTKSFVLLGDSSAPYLFLLPQTLTAWSGEPANTYLELTCVINKGGVVHNGKAYIPFGATLQQGFQYDVNINIGKNSLYKDDGTKIISE
ncbi:MAG: fimbrillin family protein [Prevotella sp.]|nr:fimbrillin family protein [Prevotella sp.]